jgi:transposase
MAKYIDADYEQTYLFPPCLEDFVSSDHPARFIREFVDNLDLNELGFIIKTNEISAGAPTYSPRLLLCGWLYGYMENIRSTRGLESACHNNLGLIWLMGMHKPDHNTFWRFWTKNSATIANLFKKSVLIANELGMINYAFHVVDGTKILAQGSKSKTWNKNKLIEDLAHLDKSIEAISKEIESSGNKSYGLPEKLSKKKTLRTEVKNKIKELEEANRNHMHPKDPDPTIMKTKSGTYELAYNAQAMVDGKSNIIVAETVVTTNDENMLVPMIDEVKKNLGKVANENLADAGYHTESQFAEAESKNYNVLVNNKDKKKTKKNPFHKSHFKYNEEKDVFVCPHTGVELINEREKKKGTNNFVYRCPNTSCPLLEKCCKDKGGRTIESTKSYQAKVRNNIRIEYPENKALLKKRGETIELCFAHIKQHTGFRRSHFKSLIKTAVQWSFICAVQNIKKIIEVVQLNKKMTNKA